MLTFLTESLINYLSTELRYLTSITGLQHCMKYYFVITDVTYLSIMLEIITCPVSSNQKRINITFQLCTQQTQKNI